MSFNINSKVIQFKTILSRAGIMDQSENIVASFTGGRETSCKKMKLSEINRAIDSLQQQYPQTSSNKVAKVHFDPKPGDNMRKKIIGMAHTMGWQIWDVKKGRFVADMEHINDWCLKYGQFHKVLNAHTEEELVQLVNQFEKVDKSFWKSLEK